MRNLMYLLLLFVFFSACQDDETAFNVSVPRENISFKPMPGGAIMFYKLPENSDIFSVQVRYTDVRGEELVCTGSYACDSVILTGFNEARQGVPAHVSLCNHRHEESRAMEVTFDTQDSAPVAFFNKAEVKPHWNGFSLIYESPEMVTGMAHVFYVGENPSTHRTDTLLLKSFPISQGRDTLFFALQQGSNLNTVVVRTEDVRGYRAKQQVWRDVEAYQTKQLASKNIELLDPENCILENDKYKVGAQYLFDGDLNGIACQTGHKTFEYYTFVAGPDATGVPFVLDLQEKVVPASMRFYAILNAVSWPGTGTSGAGIMGPIWGGWYITKLPNEVTVYASNDKDDKSSWKKIGYFHEGRELPLTDRWILRTVDRNYAIKTIDELIATKPCYMTIEFPASDETYRYLKFVINDTFANITDYSHFDQNLGRYFSFNELEVYVKNN